ncbi:MAG: gamma-glutamyltransferase, partial [Aquiluna sp.]
DGLQAAHNAFYSSEVARTIADAVTSRGGFLTEDDLAEFEAEVSTAPHIRFSDWQMFATPSWSQGPVALEILGLFQRSGGTLHDLVESISLAFNDREDFFSSPDTMERDIAEFLSDEYLSVLASSITNNAVAGRGLGIGSEDASNLGSTTSVVTMDASGCTFATSPSDTLDGGPIIEELGIICSPRGVQTRLNQRHANRMRPWGRPMVTPAALIGINGSDSWALACPGGDVIVQAIAQVAINMNSGLSPQQAVEAPRIAAFNAPSAFHPHPSADRLVYAESRIEEQEIQKLLSQGHNVELWPEFEFDAGSVQTIVSKTNPEGERYLLSGADPRRSAYAQSR